MPEIEDLIAKEVARQEGVSVEDVAARTGEEGQGGTPPAAATPAPTNEPAPAAAATPAAPADQNTPAPPAEGSAPVFTLAELDRLSNGAVKTLDDFAAVYAKAQETDVLKGKVSDYEAKALISPFADEYEQKRNELKKGGATKEQLTAFEKVNDLGELKDLDAKEALIMKMVLVDGIGEKVARIKVDKLFNLDSVFDDDKEVMESDLLQAKKDSIKALEGFKAQISTPNSDKLILDAAGKAQLQSQLKPVLENITTNFNKLESVTIAGENGVPEVTVDLNLDADSKATIANKVSEIMIEDGLQFTPENIKFAQTEAVKDYLLMNTGKIVQNALKAQQMQLEKFYSEKYENTGGKPRGDAKPGSEEAKNEAELRAFKDEILR